MLLPPTNADPDGTGWTIRDPVVRLRYFGTTSTIDLTTSERWILGASEECSIRLHDESGRVSRAHATLQREGATWMMTDLASTNGTKQNRETRKTFQVLPGDEIELGGVTLIAESELSISLHEMLQRLLGWARARLPEVDRALFAVREMANLRSVLILRGDGGQIEGTLRRLHDLVLTERRFVMLGAGESGECGLERAKNGLLAVDAAKLPRDVHLMLAGMRMPDTRVRLIVCAASSKDTAELAMLIPRIATVVIPPLKEREQELDRLIESYAHDAASAFGAATLGFRPQDVDWLRAGGFTHLDDVDFAARRLVALRNWGVAGGAKRLGISHAALSRWARRRGIPT